MSFVFIYLSKYSAFCIVIYLKEGMTVYSLQQDCEVSDLIAQLYLMYSEGLIVIYTWLTITKLGGITKVSIPCPSLYIFLDWLLKTRYCVNTLLFPG